MKLTKWFHPSVKPMLPGVYQVMSRGLRPPGDCWYAMWNGRRWGCYSHSPRDAVDDPAFSVAAQGKTWRGLAEPPKK